MRKALKEESSIACTIDNLGSLFLKAGNLDKSLDYFNQSLGMKKNLSLDGSSIAWSMSAIGDVHASRGDLNESLRFYEKALHIRQNISTKISTSEMGASFYSIGSVYKKLGNVSQAIKYFKQTMQIYDSASLLVDSSQYTKARALLDEIEAVFESLSEQEKERYLPFLIEWRQKMNNDSKTDL